ncbi:hypothetical protein AMK59_6512 [Oryctes borbonicus]|uniref:LRRCT domain-containing protein n=1 Tax=Oryctes borbonicus TaxID=1629725 RepID=A0A0T6AY65_9SCAR|nr:hypothetical protein AMK59_6512 [Oryctes borbonicus]
MFEGLNNLIYLFLEKNNLKFIPDFAFYGTANIKTLSLAHNNLLNIQIRNLAGLLELEYLDLSYNNFSQLSELSLPPFPKLKLANFGNNPINAVFPNTFEVMNTTDSIILGGLDTSLTILTNSFLGLKMLKKLTIKNLKMASLEKEIFIGMPNLNELILTGDIPKIEYDAFLEVDNLEHLILNNCNISKISVDGFMGLNKLKVLDLSRNNLEVLPYGIFDVLSSLRELYLNHNKFQELPKGIFANHQLRLIRLNNNPWHCSCIMSDWKPVLINRIKQKVINGCNQEYDKGIGCGDNKNEMTVKYMYENSVAPKCSTPKKYQNWNVFHVLRKQLKCVDFKPKLKKKYHKLKKFNITNTTIATQSNVTKNNVTIEKITEINNDISTENSIKLRKNLENANKIDNLNSVNNEDFLINKALLKSIDSNNLNTYLSPQNFNNLVLMEPENFPEKPRKPLKRRYKKKMYKQNMFGKMKKIDM